MKKADLDLYTDYLLSTFGAATATGLSAMLEGDVSHDQITGFYLPKNTPRRTCGNRSNEPSD